MSAANPRAEALFAAALELADAQARRAYLDQACGEDASLRTEVASLLAAYERAGPFLEKPAAPGLPRPPKPGAHVRYFGDYELLEEIARGGMGVVYKARQVSLNRIVAVKMILAGRLASETEITRFRSEAEAAGSLRHPHIVGIYEIGEHAGYHYFSMPFVEGPSLAQLVESGRWQPGDGTEAARLLATLARAIQYAHEAGLLHRDLKPGNILISPAGEPCITDFGLAKRVAGGSNLTLSGDLLGTPSFMAPEQAAGKTKRISAAADIYSLGAVLYYLLTRRPPFVADSALDALLLVVEGETVLPRSINPAVPVELERICLRCLEKAPENRYASAGELAADLERFLKGEPLARIPRELPHRLYAWARRQPALVSRLLALAICLSISVTAYQIHHHVSPRRHVAALTVLGLWAWISVLCQKALTTGVWAGAARFVWAGADVACLTAILLIDQALESPLTALYPALVATSGLWLRVPLVAFTTGTVVLGYSILVLHTYHRHAAHVPPHWHLVVFVVLVLSGLSVAYLVHRVRALTRFYERGPEP